MRKALLVSATLLGLMAFVPAANACGWGGYGYYGYGGCGCGYADYAWRHGLVGLGHCPLAVPARIAQPRGGGPELDLVLRNVPPLDAAHHHFNLTSP